MELPSVLHSSEAVCTFRRQLSFLLLSNIKTDTLKNEQPKIIN